MAEFKNNIAPKQKWKHCRCSIHPWKGQKFSEENARICLYFMASVLPEEGEQTRSSSRRWTNGSETITDTAPPRSTGHFVHDESQWAPPSRWWSACCKCSCSTSCTFREISDGQRIQQMSASKESLFWNRHCWNGVTSMSVSWKGVICRETLIRRKSIDDWSHRRKSMLRN